jgi:hypothetical protein
MGQERSTCPPHLVVLLTTGNKPVFSRECNTKTSRKSHIRRRSSHEVVTVSSHLDMHAISDEGRSKHEGKVAVSRSASLPRGVNHAGRGALLERSRREKRPTSLTLWVLLLTAQFPRCFAPLRPNEGLLALWLLVSRSHETQKNHFLLNHP